MTVEKTVYPHDTRVPYGPRRSELEKQAQAAGVDVRGMNRRQMVEALEAAPEKPKKGKK